MVPELSGVWTYSCSFLDMAHEVWTLLFLIHFVGRIHCTQHFWKPAPSTWPNRSRPHDSSPIGCHAGTLKHCLEAMCGFANCTWAVQTKRGRGLWWEASLMVGISIYAAPICFQSHYSDPQIDKHGFQYTFSGDLLFYLIWRPLGFSLFPNNYHWYKTMDVTTEEQNHEIGEG